MVGGSYSRHLKIWNVPIELYRVLFINFRIVESVVVVPPRPRVPSSVNSDRGTSHYQTDRPVSTMGSRVPSQTFSSRGEVNDHSRSSSYQPANTARMVMPRRSVTETASACSQCISN